MEIKIQKWGNSLAIRIPKSYIKDINLEQGSVIDILKEKDRIIIKPKQRQEKLRDLLKKINDENIHEEIAAGKRSGNEIW